MAGVSKSVRDIFEQFRFGDSIERIEQTDLLLLVTQRFAAGLERDDMGSIFEELIRELAEQRNETASAAPSSRA